ncbi:PilN domain-containing protein [Aquimarina sp. U1-2]|uniref:PilN domain-containing protein n=1 Tax=Aquimarina sp. U1-2 TaxID=2823141 RepID=UPI001AECD747|nr:PilN domain-containing protein [Aquimarina sp. U1-2]MBP2832828.1 PilN domain-containing protein [Aquimarina sp. U1-2]
MLDTIKNISSTFFQEKKYAVIGIILGDIPTYNVLIIDKKSEDIAINTFFSTQDFEVIKAKVNTSLPVLINFFGKGVINKKVSSQGNYLKEVLFNASVDDFYIYELTQLDQKFISIARKAVIQPYFDNFKADRYLIVDYSIGPFVGAILQNLVSEPTITSYDYELVFEQESVVDYTKDEKNNVTYTMGEEQIDTIQVPLFSTLIQYLYPSDNLEYTKDFLGHSKQEHSLKKIVNTVGIFLGIFFLSTLLISYFLLTYYNDKYVAYESQLYNLNDTYSQVKKLEEEKQNKTKIINESGILNQNFLSFYMYRMASSVPNKVSLDIVRVNPTLKKVKNFEKIEFETNAIIILGSADSSTSINNWVKQLKKEDWVAKIEILDFSTSRERKNEFTLKIMVK